MGTSAVLEEGTKGATDEDMAGTLFTNRWVDNDLRGSAADHFATLVDDATADSIDGAYAYDAARVVLDAIEGATSGSEHDLAKIRKGVLANVAATTRFTSTVGLTWSFDDAGDTTPSGITLVRMTDEGFLERVEVLVVP